MEKSRDLWGGVGVTLFAVFMIWQSSQYSFGNLFQAGPGFFPLVFSSVLLLLGVLMIAGSLVFGEASETYDNTPERPVAWRSLLAVSAGILIFYMLISRVGLVPAAFGLVMVSAFAERPVNLRRTLLTAVILSVIVIVIFIYLFRLPLSAFEWP